MVDGGDFDFARGWWRGFFQLDVAEANFAICGPAEAELQLGRSRFGGHLIGSGHALVAGGIFAGDRQWKLGLLDLFSILVEPENAGDDAAGWRGDIGEFVA